SKRYLVVESKKMKYLQKIIRFIFIILSHFFGMHSRRMPLSLAVLIHVALTYSLIIQKVSNNLYSYFPDFCRDFFHPVVDVCATEFLKPHFAHNFSVTHKHNTL